MRSLRYLNLSEAGFSGPVPLNLGNLSSLEFLDVSSPFSGLAVSSLEWVRGLVSLKHLAINGVDLSMVGSNWLGVLNMLPHLAEIHLSDCGLSGSVLSHSSVNFTSLSVIDLSLNHFDSIFPDWLVNISSLSYVDLSICGLYGRIPLGFRSWKKIEVLSLATNKLHGKLPSSIGNMSSLTNFDLFSNSVEGGIPSSIGKLCNLKFFDLSGNNLTGSLPEVLERTSCVSNNPMPSLIYLRLGVNHLVGNLPAWLGELENLAELTLDYNMIQGPIPASLGNLHNLTNLGLAGNQLNGSLPDSFGQLSQLRSLDVSFNHLSGFITELHFSRLHKLKFLHLSSNSFSFNVSSNWIPPFHLQNLDLGSCYLGPSFPDWLRTQKEVGFLDFSNASISDTIPNWFWEISSNLSLLNVSFNQLQGLLPNPLSVAPYADVDFSSNLLEGPLPLPTVGIDSLDLSNNHFSGPIPQNITESMPDLIFLSLSNLSHNNLSGVIPELLGQLNQLQSIHLSNNNLTGKLPLSLQNLSSLETLDLGNNSLSGNIPLWIGGGFPQLRILSLRSNAFSGEIPSNLANLSSLQVLDLADNKLTGAIPETLGDFKAMSKEQYVNQYLLYGKYRGLYYGERFVMNIKGGSQKYTKTLSLVTSIDLSINSLNGEFPDQITKLVGLVTLNLSKNQVSGHVPDNISSLRQLSSLDLSSNRLSGAIPSSLPALSFLSYLNLSNNNLSGTIPYRGQMTTFEASSFSGNPGLCGPPLVLQCQGDDSGKGGTSTIEDSDDGFIDRWFYLSIGLGFAAGILVPMLVFAIKKPWRVSYFGFVDKIVDRAL
ncbi:receptor-like protein EIX2 [Populus alba x Populus x berolinensis]|uniref:Receptor-like protein EIX2 n=1 Tax=Populus alba x Populus x berolinensis TaxID=444605 RepID=A0AAD6WHE7_9ROSI|nr:receptor-like protein EIX2 [Populus alba x Populus x berolinensis]